MIKMKYGAIQITIDEIIDLIKKHGLKCSHCRHENAKFISEGKTVSVENKKYSSAHCIILECPKCKESMNFIYDSENNSVKIIPPYPEEE